MITRLSAAVLIGNSRTMQADFDFAIRQLVDIGLRALSPGINDPTTAAEVSLRLGSLMRRLLVADLQPEVVTDRHGTTLLRPWELSHDEYISHAFDQLRRTALPQSQVIAALLRVLRMLILHVQLSGRCEYIPALRHQLQQLLQDLDGESRLHPDDLTRLRAIAEAATDPADHGASSTPGTRAIGGGAARRGLRPR